MLTRDRVAVAAGDGGDQVRVIKRQQVPHGRTDLIESTGKPGEQPGASQAVIARPAGISPISRRWAAARHAHPTAAPTAGEPERSRRLSAVSTCAASIRSPSARSAIVRATLSTR